MDIFEQVKKILCEQLDLEEEQVTEDSAIIDDPRFSYSDAGNA